MSDLRRCGSKIVPSFVLALVLALAQPAAAQPVSEAERRIALAGDYYSPEHDTHYEILIEGDDMVARHQRHPDIQLIALGADELAGDQWFFSRLRFERDASGAVTGMRVTGGRVRDLRFERR